MPLLISQKSSFAGQAAAAVLEAQSTGQFFYNQKLDRRAQPFHTDVCGLLRCIGFVAAFGFYLFSRSTTLDPAATGTLYAYQIAVLLAECAIFSSGVVVGLWQVGSSQLNYACLI